MDTNKLLKKVVSNVRSYKKRSLVRILAVDIENCRPIHFTDETYSYKKHGDCMFMYIDEEYNIMGILKGSEHKPEYEDVERYDDQHRRNYRYSVIKNRKHMEPKATYVLMLTPAMRNYRPKHKRRNKKKDYRRELRQRLLEYKKQKYKNIDHDKTVKMTKEVINTMSQALFGDNEEEMVKKIRKVDHWDREIPEGIRSFINIVKDYKRYYEELEGSNSKYDIKYYQPKVKERRVSIIKWYNTICA